MSPSRQGDSRHGGKRSEPDDALWLLAAPGDPGASPARTGSRRRARQLSRDQIVATAIAVADAEGPEAVSMRRVARDLNVSAMSLYWHVASKDDLLVLMVDAVEGEIDIPSPSGDWRADVTRTARGYRQTLLRHGWMTSFIGHRRSLGPNELVHIEHSLAALDPLQLTIHDAFNVLMAVETYYLGFALREQQELMIERTREELSPAELRAVVSSGVERLRATNRYPHLTQLFEAERRLTRDERFEYGLARLLDGIEADLRRGATREVGG